MISSLLLAVLLAAGVAASARAGEAPDDPAPPTTVAHVDLSRYVGLWYEIAKIPNKFQKQCAKDATAEYELRDDGTIRVINRCIEHTGHRNEAKGVARIVDPETNAKLEVSFVSFLGWRPIWGDYWILGLDPGYRWAVIGTPSRKYGWVLARTPHLDEASLDEVFGILEREGYSRDDFELSPQKDSDR